MRSWSFLGEADLAAWYGPSQLRRVLVVLRALLRIPAAIRLIEHSDVVVVQREALPLGPPLLELFAGRRRPLVWDVDDAIWAEFTSPTAGRVPRWLRATGDKYVTLGRKADEVWAGSEVLAQWCRAHNAATFVVPTVVEVPEERPEHVSNRVVTWVGSHSTGPFLERILPALAAVEPNPVVRVVGAVPRNIPRDLAVDVRQWSIDNERDALDKARVGVYPIDTAHPLADGKCGLKAVLYMAHGIPPVVTPTTTNATVVRDRVDGLFAETPADWTRCVAELLDDAVLWESLSASAHQRALDDYSVRRWAPWWAEAVRRLAPGGQDRLTCAE
jgi:glycosyltransferase involved in cell wall biosynthesis